MAQELVQEQEKQWLELEDISPTWKATLDREGGLTETEWLTLEHSAELCIVGEAHGWSRKYSGGKDECVGCCCFAGEIPSLHRNIRDRDIAIRKFVEHWNIDHRHVLK